MVARPYNITVLDYFRVSKDIPLIQFLTWHIVLVEQWSFEDVATVDFTPMRINWIGGTKRDATGCRFTFKDGRRINLIVAEKEPGWFYVDSSIGTA